MTSGRETIKTHKLTSIHDFAWRKFQAYKEYYGLSNNETLLHLFDAAGV